MTTYLSQLIAVNTTKINKILSQPHKYLAVVTLSIIVVYHVLFPFQATVAEKDTSMFNMLLPTEISLADMPNYSNDFPNKFPISETVPALYSTYITATAYSSTPDQTDDTPCITANGFNLCEHGHNNIIASNYLPLGSRVRFPEVYGDRIFYVMDRMNSRYDKRVDIWLNTREEARQFGKKYIKMEVL